MAESFASLAPFAPFAPFRALRVLRVLGVPGAVRVPGVGRLARPVGVEADEEQLHQHRGDRGVRGQRLLHVRLAERDPGLAQVLAVRAQDHDLAPSEPRPQHQPVEAVVLDLPRPDAGERVAERLVDAVRVEVGAFRVEHPEIVDPHPRGAHALDLARMLVLDLQTHVLQHRERVGEHHRAAPDLEELEAQPPLRRFERAVEAHLDAVLPDALHLLHVEHRDPRGVGLAVVGAEGLAVAPEQARAVLLAEGLEQRVVQIVGPGAAHREEAALQVRDVVARGPLRIDVDDEVEPGQHRLRQPHRELGVRPAERLLEDPLDHQPALGREALSRHEHDAREEPPEPVRVHEQPDPLPLLQVEDPHRGLEQLVGRDLEEHLAGERVDGVLQRLGGVAVARVAGAGEHVGGLAPQQGDVARHAVVGGGGVEAEEPAHPADPALGVELPDADVVEMARAVHGGADVRAGEHEKIGLLRVAPPARRRQVGERIRGPPAFIAQQPEPRARLGHIAFKTSGFTTSGFTTFGFTTSGLLDPEFAEPQEREVVVLDPLEEGAGLLELLGMDERRRRPQFRDAPAKLLAHRDPVVHRGADVVERAAHLRLDRVEHLGLGLAIGLEVDDRLDDGALARVVDGKERLDAAVLSPAEAQHGVDHEVARVPAAVHDHAHRVDQERHVVGDDLEDGMGRLPAVLLDLGVVDPDLRRARRAPPGEVEVRRRGAVEILRLALGEVLGRDPGVVPGDEGKDEIEVLASHPLACERCDFVHQLRQLGRRLGGHGSPPLASFRCRAASSRAAASGVLPGTAGRQYRPVPDGAVPGDRSGRSFRASRLHFSRSLSQKKIQFLRTYFVNIRQMPLQRNPAYLHSVCHSVDAQLQVSRTGSHRTFRPAWRHQQHCCERIGSLFNRW